MKYEIYRGGTLVGTVKNDDIPVRSGGYGEQKTKYKVKEYDHVTFADRSVRPGTSYTYKVRAVDTAGQPGAWSAEAAIRTKPNVQATSGPKQKNDVPVVIFKKGK